MELGPRNITSNVVAPGFFPSKLASGLIEKLGGTGELSEANPRKRLGEPEDIAGVMIYLCSPAGSYMYVLHFFTSLAVLCSNCLAEMVLISLWMAAWSCQLAGTRSYENAVSIRYFTILNPYQCHRSGLLRLFPSTSDL